MPTNKAGSSNGIQFQGPTKRPPLRNDPEHLVSSIRANTTGPNMTTDEDINGSEGNKNVASSFASERNNSAAVAECTDDEDPSFKKEGSYAPQEEQVRRKPAKSKKTQRNNYRDRANTPGPNMATNGNIHGSEGNKNVSTTFASERNDSATVGECKDDEDSSFDEEESYAPQEREVPTNTASPKEKPKPAPTLETEKSGGSVWIGGLTTVIFIIIAYHVCFMLQSKPVEGEPFYKLGTAYPTVDQNLWQMLSVSVRRAITTVDNPEPGTILFLHYGPTDILDGLIDSVIAVTTSHFGNTDAIRLPGAHFKRSDIQQDFGVFVAQQKEALRQRSVMLVRNLEDVPARSARAFHTICDTQEPLVGKAVIYLTLDMAKAAGMHEPSNVSATAEAERLLQKLWGDSLEPAVLGPLITRLTDNVFRIV
uniref:SEA domain-containing protein n=1 Tax=Anopheles coluzzii TaxID=1518534 RepID=A0ABM2ATD1_ANOCL